MVEQVTYKVGDTIEYLSCLSRKLRRVKVTARCQITATEPGFDGVLVPGGQTVWGYDSDVIAVVKRGKR